MLPPVFRTFRYARSWISGSADIVDEDLSLDRDGTAVPATLARPRRVREQLPAWVVLHGITRRGRAHPQLVRFTRAVVSTGAVAIVPDVPEWRRFQLAPQLAVPTVEAAIGGLALSKWTRDEPCGIIGFSFGAPHAITATAHPRLRDHVAGSVAFGGYCDLERTLRFLMTGGHEWKGQQHHLTPDPYGRWIVAANYLTAVPGYEDAADVASALRALASRAGESGVSSLDPSHDVHKKALRGSVTEQRRPLFDLFAPSSTELPDAEAGRAMAEALAAAARRVDPAVEPRQALATVERPVHVLHGRHDHLIPFSEGLRLQGALPPGTWSKATVTGLFGHSGRDRSPSALRALGELPAFLGALRRVLRLV